MVSYRGAAQYGAAFAASLLAMSVGTSTSWTTPTLPMLLSEDSPIDVTVTKMEAALITSLLLFGSIFGNLFIGPVMNLFGRRGTLLLCVPPLFICWLVVLFAKSVKVLYVARFLTGFVGSVPIAACVVYISEISEPHVRGKLTVICLVSMEIGQLLVTAAGSYISYKALALLCSLIPIVFLLIFYWFPESPYHYLRKGDTEQARKCLRRLRDNSVSEELVTISNNVEFEMQNKSRVQDVIFRKDYRKELLIVIGLKTLQQMSGSVAIQSYMGIIFDQASTGLDSEVSTIICTAIAIPSLLVSFYIVDKFGRKPLYYLSTMGCTVSLLFEFTYFYLQDNLEMNMASLSWLPVSGIFLFYIFRSLGVTSLPYLLLGELFPTNIKGMAVSVCLFYGSVLSFLVALGFPGLVALWGMSFTFLMFALFCLLGFVFILFVLPETKGKSLSEIQHEMHNEETQM